MSAVPYHNNYHCFFPTLLEIDIFVDTFYLFQICVDRYVPVTPLLASWINSERVKEEDEGHLAKKKKKKKKMRVIR